ncbi:MAG: 23S rRNA (pseudouridine(1915)-N(3))-methyltransferase RlmH [Longimicrobiales bacterium]|nr:23S rRNA (pseudouridine(1915)-N(3))-methyltransferase RlmH [Longimicrobiales bacterium]
MKIVCVVVGGVKGPVAPAVEEFTIRADRYFRIEWIEVGAGVGRDASPSEVRRAEGDRILARIPEGATLAALTREGKGMTSRGLARWLDRAALDGRDLAFAIGGAFGLDAKVLARARRRLSLSPMTLPHEIARLVWAEQLYRAGTILRNEPYHKGS